MDAATVWCCMCVAAFVHAAAAVCCNAAADSGAEEHLEGEQLGGRGYWWAGLMEPGQHGHCTPHGRYACTLDCLLILPDMLLGQHFALRSLAHGAAASNVHCDLFKCGRGLA